IALEEAAQRGRVRPVAVVVEGVGVGDQPRRLRAGGAGHDPDVEAVEEEALMAEVGEGHRMQVVGAEDSAVGIVGPLADVARGAPTPTAVEVARSDQVATGIHDGPPGIAPVLSYCTRSSTKPASAGPQTYSRSRCSAAVPPPIWLPSPSASSPL